LHLELDVVSDEVNHTFYRKDAVFAAVADDHATATGYYSLVDAVRY